jgi:hypothetical protein
MGQLFLEPDGRLRMITVVSPEQSEPAPAEVEPEWTPFFEAAGLDLADAKPVAPRWRPPVGSDRRFAWVTQQEGTRAPVRVEAASLDGSPVWLEVFTPWRRATTPPRSSVRPADRLFDLVVITLQVGALLLGAALASRNLRRRRGDRQGAARLAGFVGICTLLSVALRSHHLSDAFLEGRLVMMILSDATFAAAMIWVWYIALEPYLRRRWPHALISWSRLLQKRWLDPRVGRDILIGVLTGASIRLVHFLTLAAPEWLGWSRPIPSDRAFFELSGWRFTIGFLFDDLANAAIMALGVMVILLISHLLLRKRALAVAVVVLALTTFFGSENYPLLEWPTRFLLAGAISFVMVRYGLVALAVAFLTYVTFGNLPIGLDPSQWYFMRALVGFSFLIALAVFGFVRALGPGELFAEPILED